MTLDEWLESARRDALSRGLPGLVPALEGLAGATATLRAADWNDDVSGATREAHAGSAAPGPAAPEPDAHGG